MGKKDQRTSGKVVTEEKRNSGYSGPVEQWNNDSGYRGAVEQWIQWNIGYSGPV